MTFEERKQSLLEFLSQQDNYLSSGTIAKKLKISKRTIIRYVDKINRDCDNNKLIISEKGKGYRLDYDKYLEEKSNTKQISDFSPVERRNEILLKLLMKSPRKISVDYLFEKFYVSEAVMNGDLTFIKSQLSKYKISIIRQNRFVGVMGNELAIRRALLRYVPRINDIDEELLNKDFSLLNKYDMRFVVEQFHSIEEQLNSIIPYPYNINIFSHLCILINRYRSGIEVSSDDSDFDINGQKNTIEANGYLYQISSKLINNFSSYLGHELPNQEKYYLLQYLISSRLFSNSENEPNYSDEVEKITHQIIETVLDNYKGSISTTKLKIELINHIKPLLNRIKNKIFVSNRLLPDIKNEYSEIFEIVKIAVNKIFIQYFGETLSDDEIGFITLYFAKAVEQEIKSLCVLIMCASGVGTSELLKVKVHRAFPDLKIEDVVSLRQYRKNSENYDKQIDLIISSIVLNEVVGKPSILVSAMFNKNDQKNVERLIRELKNK